MMWHTWERSRSKESFRHRFKLLGAWRETKGNRSCTYKQLWRKNVFFAETNPRSSMKTWWRWLTRDLKNLTFHSSWADFGIKQANKHAKGQPQTRTYFARRAIRVWLYDLEVIASFLIKHRYSAITEKWMLTNASVQFSRNLFIIYKINLRLVRPQQYNLFMHSILSQIRLFNLTFNARKNITKL